MELLFFIFVVVPILNVIAVSLTKPNSKTSYLCQDIIDKTPSKSFEKTLADIAEDLAAQNKKCAKSTKTDIIEAEIIESKPKSTYLVPKSTSLTPYRYNYTHNKSGDRLRDLANEKYEPKRSYRPTNKQIRACEKIARDKNLWLPNNYDKDWRIASGFITKFGDKA